TAYGNSPTDTSLARCIDRPSSSVGVSEPMSPDFACIPSALPSAVNQATQPEEAHDQTPHLHRAPCRHGRSPQPRSQQVTAKTVFYASTGPELTLFDVDVADAALQKRSTVTLPANVQYAWPHPSKHWLYVVSSSGGPGVAGTTHLANAFRIDPGSGA